MRTARRVVCVPHAEPFWRDSTQECAEHSNSFNPTQRRLDRSTAAHPSLAPAIVSWASPKATVSPTAVCDETTSGLVHYDHSHIPHRQQPRLAQPPPALAAGGEQALTYGSAATMGAVYIVVATFPTRLRCISPPPWIRTALQRLATLREKIIPPELAMRSDPCPIAGKPWRSTTARSSRLAIEAARVWVQSEVSMMSSRAAGGHAMGAARQLTGAPRFAAYSAGAIRDGGAACALHCCAASMFRVISRALATDAADPSRRASVGLSQPRRGRGDFDVELDSQTAREPLQRAERRLVVTGLEARDRRLLHPQLASKRRLRQPMIHAVGQHAHRHGARQGCADVLRVHLSVGQVLSTNMAGCPQCR